MQEKDKKPPENPFKAKLLLDLEAVDANKQLLKCECTKMKATLESKIP